MTVRARSLSSLVDGLSLRDSKLERLIALVTEMRKDALIARKQLIGLASRADAMELELEAIKRRLNVLENP